LNRDGWLDVVTATVPAELLGPSGSIGGDDDLLGVTVGHDSTPIFPGFSVQARPRPVATATADFNEDGFPDIAVAQSETASISILLNQSNAWASLGHDLGPPSGGSTPWLTASGTPVADAEITLEVSSPLLESGGHGLLLAGFEANYLPIESGSLVPSMDVKASVTSNAPLVTRWPKGIAAGTSLYLQCLFARPDGKVLASNALVVIAQ